MTHLIILAKTGALIWPYEKANSLKKKVDIIYNMHTFYCTM